ncbi:glycosyl hydrolase family 76 [Niastella caeni]|uniref:Glycosyl hydrolase family 76 n=1 Tax=Niastella caeni TaxID=2569763 RepID=A0A4S8HXK7_9BACT|nr:glycoside hydrolase family 76 protein [Niastella caeni]THU40235.1 glycosyl hydrolase family 76 [Niastella caeni]
MNKRHFSLLWYIPTALLICILSCCLKQKPDDPPPPEENKPTATYNWPAIADSAERSLNYFWSASGKYYFTSNASSDWGQYWPNAHGLDVLVDAYLRNPSASLKSQMLDLIGGVKAKNGNTMINYYYDDMEWMALACLRAYNATGEMKFKEATDLLWNDIKNGWSSDLGGGVWWRKDNSSKNTPSNMPAAILAARLYKKFNKAEDLQWAQKIYDWQKQVLYEASSGWVYDNIDKTGAKNTTWKFTYNQGTFLGAALELFLITGNNNYLNDAYKVTDYTLNSGFLTNNGVLKDEGGGDGGLFKGIFIRYFTRLIIDGSIDATKKTAYLNFITGNATTCWSKGTNKNLVLFGSAWDKVPGNTTDLTIQLSGIMLFEAMAELKKMNLVE